MSNEVFSKERPVVDHAGRVMVFTRRPEQIRLRSDLFWAGCHWVGESILCAGSECPLCQVGSSKRSYGFAMVETPASASRVARFSAADVAKLLARDGASAADWVVGDVYTVVRPGERQPLDPRFVKHCAGIRAATSDELVLEVLRLHRILTTHQVVRERQYWELVLDRARVACGQRSLPVQ